MRFALIIRIWILGAASSGFSCGTFAIADDVASKQGASLSPPTRILQSYCYDCHTGDDAEGGIRLDVFRSDFEIDSRVELVEKIIRVLKEHQMPPIDAEQPPIGERLAALKWIETRLNEFDCGSVSRPGRVTMRRLNRSEYNNTIRDLTGLDLRLADDFPSDDVGNGFDSIGDVLTIAPILLEKYLAAANRIAQEVFESEQAAQKVFPFQPGDPDDRAELARVARANATSFASRAFRRPLKPEESDRLFDLMRSARREDASREDMNRTLVAAILTSPHFIYRIEEDDPNDFVDGIRPLNDYELASRLSYFIWSSMPDERLFDLAREGSLHTAEQLAAEATRMLADPKSQALVENFVGQWLQLRDLKLLSPDPELFGGFDEELRRSMRTETELLFAYLMAENRSLLELLNADYTFVNGRLAEHYGIDGIAGDEFRRVDLQGRRSGVLMHGSILLLTSNPTRTSPVKRGKWILDNLLGEPPPPPPPDVPELGESEEMLGTLRQRMEQHRANPDCAVCHTKMDALGFGLENFDAIGKWRDADGHTPVDPSGELPGGRSFDGPVALVKILAEDKKEEFARCVAKKMLTYALGRGLGVYDRCTLDTIENELAEKGYKFESLVKAIVISPQFTSQESGR